MEFIQRCGFLIAFFFVFCGRGPTVFGHDVSGYQELGVVGFLAPFGLASQHTYTEVWGEENLAFLGSQNDGVAIINVADATNPQLSGNYRSPSLLDVSDVKSRAGVGYFASKNGGGIHIVDLANPSQPIQLSEINSQSEQGFDNVSELAIENGTVFAVSSTSSLVKVFDVSDTANPKFLREFSTAETIGLSDIQVTDDRVYVAGLGGHNGTGAVYVFDRSEVVDPNATPTELGRISSGTNTGSISINEETDHLLSTQLELGGEISVWNIQDFTSPSRLAVADVSDFALNSFSTGEVVVDGQIAYVAWYEAGFQILDLDNLSEDGTLQLIGGYDTSPFSSPLDGLVGNRSVFPFLGAEKVLLSDTEWGLFIVDATPALPIVGDVDGNGQLDANDIDQMTLAIQAGIADLNLDFDGSGNVSLDDRTFLVVQLLGATFGDSNLDGTFDSSDLVRVFIAGKYEDGIDSNAIWAEGDWNGDGDFSSSDLIAAFTTGDYENRTPLNVVPEPLSYPLAVVVTWYSITVNRNHRRRNER